jgi:hypothetical protein
MGRKLYDEDGNEFDVPTEEELKDLQTKAASAGKLDEFNTQTAEIRKALDLKDDDDIISAVKNIKESANPNWPKARHTIETLTAFIKASNKDAEIDADGNIKTKAKELTQEDIEAITEKKIAESLAKNTLATRLGAYPEGKREVVKSYFDKLSSGQELNAENIDKYIKEAEVLSFPTVRATQAPLEGGEPKLSAEGSQFVESAKGKEAAEALFGEESFTKK